MLYFFFRKRCRHGNDCFPGLRKNTRPRWYPAGAVHNDAHRLFGHCHGVVSHSETGIVGNDRIDADHDSIGNAPLVMNISATVRVAYPSSIPGACCDLSIKAHGIFGDNKWHAGGYEFEKAFVEFFCIFCMLAEFNLYSSFLKDIYSTAANDRVRIGEGNMHLFYSSLYYCPGTRAGSPMMAAWLKSHVKNGIPRFFSRILQCNDLGMIKSRRLRIPPSHNNAILNNNRSDRGIRAGHALRLFSLSKRHHHIINSIDFHVYYSSPELMVYTEWYPMTDLLSTSIT